MSEIKTLENRIQKSAEAKFKNAMDRALQSVMTCINSDLSLNGGRYFENDDSLKDIRMAIKAFYEPHRDRVVKHHIEKDSAALLDRFKDFVEVISRIGGDKP